MNEEIIRRYGKDVDFSLLNRNIKSLQGYMRDLKKKGKKYYKNNVISKKCRICGSTKIHKYVTVNGCYDYYECENCKAIVLGNLPNIQDMYLGSDDDGNIYLDDSLFKRRVEMITQPKIDFALENLPLIDNWTDIGCGIGEALFCLKHTKIKAIGIESDKRELEFASKKGLNVIEGYVSADCSNPDVVSAINASDVISFFNVIEHIEKPTEFIDYIYKNTQNSSYVVFDTPKHPSMASFVNYIFNEQVHRHMVAPLHLQIFSMDSLEIMLKGKYEIVATWEYGQGYTDLLNNVMIATGGVEDKLYYDLLKLSNQIEKVLDENYMGDQILIIGKRIG